MPTNATNAGLTFVRFLQNGRFSMLVAGYLIGTAAQELAKSHWIAATLFFSLGAINLFLAWHIFTLDVELETLDKEVTRIELLIARRRK